MDQGEREASQEICCDDKSSAPHSLDENVIIHLDADSSSFKEGRKRMDGESEPSSNDSVLNLSVSKSNYVTEGLKVDRNNGGDHQNDNFEKSVSGSLASLEIQNTYSLKTFAQEMDHINCSGSCSDHSNEQPMKEQIIKYDISENSSSSSVLAKPKLDHHNPHESLLSSHFPEHGTTSAMMSSTLSTIPVESHSLTDGKLSFDIPSIQVKHSWSLTCSEVNNETVNSTSLPVTSCGVQDETSHPQIPRSASSACETMNTSELEKTSDQGHISSWSPHNPNAPKDSQYTPPTSTCVNTSSTPSSSTNVASVSQLYSNDSEIEDSSALESLSQSSIKIENLEHDSDADSMESDVQEEMAAADTSLKSPDAPFKILTKYVYINKALKPKSGKKKIGLLYKQAFRHFHRSKYNSKSPLGKFLTKIGNERLTKVGNERSAKQKVQNLKKEPKKKTKKVVSVKAEQKIGRGRGKRTKTISSPAEKKPKGNSTLTIKIKDTTQRRKSQRNVGKKQSASPSQKSGRKRSGRKKGKSKKRKSFNFSEKVDVLNELECPSASIESVAEDFNADTKTIEKIVRDKYKILAKLEVKEGKERKKKDKRESRKKEPINLPDIKEERFDEDLNDNETQMDCADDSGDFSLDPFHSRPRKGSKAIRTRNELTLQQKVAMIHDLEKPGAKVRHIAKKFGVSSSAVSRVRRQKDRILSQSLSGDVCQDMKRTRECKDPILDRALLKWYRAVEALQDNPISITNTLLVDKARDIAIAMGKSYFPSINWIIRWKYRHNIIARSGRIESKEVLEELDSQVDLVDIITAAEGQMISADLKTEIKIEKAEKLIICEHCGIMTNRRKDKRRNNHLKTCPLATQIQRRDLTLGEKAQVARALEKPGMKMVTLAKKYGVSSSAISRIHKNRVDILARCAGSYVNVGRKRDRGSKEPEVERLLCEWYHTQQEFGYHVSSTMIREKARDIAAHMGKTFWPSDSWVFRWRHRNNVNALSGFEEIDDDEVEEIMEEEFNEGKSADVGDKEMSKTEGEVEESEGQEKGKKRKRKRKKDAEDGEPEEKKTRFKLPLSVMCEKCGCVSARLKNNRIRTMRHAKGCPDLKPRHELTYEERVRMLKALEEPGATLSSVARQFGISASSMSRMNQKKDTIMSFGMDYAGQKRIRDCKEPEVAKLLYVWFMEKQQEGIHVTGTKLKEKAASLALEMGREFKASTGWLGRWKHRYNVIFRKDETKPKRELPKKRNPKRKSNSHSLKQEEVIEPQEEDHQDSAGAESVITILPDQTQPFQAPRMFLNQRYQTPWTINHQPTSTSCARSKEFISPPNHGVPEENHVPYAYDHMPRHMFHNVFENFSSTAGYPVTMVEPSVPVRDYLQQEENEVHHPSSSHHHIIPHQPPPLNLHTAGLVQPHSSHPQQPPPIHHPSPSPGTPSQEEENIQQQQIMDACKLMNSFAKERSLGEHVQAALRTIEMTLKSNERKGSQQRTTYTNI